jgi:hypothetical protein
MDEIFYPAKNKSSKFTLIKHAHFSEACLPSMWVRLKMKQASKNVSQWFYWFVYFDNDILPEKARFIVSSYYFQPFEMIKKLSRKL